MSKSSLAEKIPFWGSKINPEFKFLQQVLNNKIQQVNLSRNCFRELLKILYAKITAQNNSDQDSQFFEKLQSVSEQHQISMYNLTLIYSSLLKLIQSAMRLSSIKQDVLKEDLNEILKFPVEYTNDFASIIYGQKRESIEQCLVLEKPKLASVKSMQWRIDVIISTSSINRTLEPSIVIQMHLSDERKVSFEMSLSSFSLLRFNVALVLKEMDDLLNRQMFKLTNE